MKTLLTVLVSSCYPAHLLNSLALIVLVVWQFSGFPIASSWCQQTLIHLHFWFRFWCSIPYIAVAGTWGAVVTSNGRSWHSPTSFIAEIIQLGVVFMKVGHQAEDVSFQSVSWVLFIKGSSSFSSSLSASFRMSVWVLPLLTPCITF